jgi:hypothetical protein
MLGIDNRGHRVRGCPSPQPSPRNGVPAAQAQRGAPSGEREPGRVCDTSVRNVAGAELAEALAALCAPDFLDNALGGDYLLVI